jgi:hypothetical protein
MARPDQPAGTHAITRPGPVKDEPGLARRAPLVSIDIARVII